MITLKRIVVEAHRRSLWQVLGVYGVGSWAVLQVVDMLTEHLGLPAWTVPFAFILLLVGLPVVLATAFVQEGMGSRGEAASGAAAAREAGHEPDARPVPARGGVHRRLLTWRNAIGGGMAAFAIWGVAAAGWLALGGASLPGERDGGALSSIAVLPFATVHMDEENRAFVAGIHDDLLTQLAKIDSLTVISRTSVMRYQGTTRPIREIAAELGVATILEGGVQRSGSRVRVNVQLIEAATDDHLWAETYDEELTAANVFAIQSRLARDIARALHAHLSPDTRARIGLRPTESLEAYELLARARFALATRGTTRAGLDSALGLLHQAIDADPAFAPAYADLAFTHLERLRYNYAAEAEAFPAARRAAERALAFDPDLADAYVTLATMHRWTLRLDEAEAALRRALALNPGSARAHSALAGLLAITGREEEALRESRRAIQLDPLTPQLRRAYMVRLNDTGRYDEALAEAERIFELVPDDAETAYAVAQTWVLRGDPERGIAEVRKAIRANPEDAYYVAALAWALARAGRREEALAELAAAQRLGAPLKEQAIVLGELGELDRAFALLERSLASDHAMTTSLLTDPTATALLTDPRWPEFERRLRRP